METTATEKLEIRSCECCSPTAEKVEHTEAASVAEHGTTGQVSRIETRIKESAGLCDCGCETSGCDCGCECCEP